MDPYNLLGIAACLYMLYLAIGALKERNLVGDDTPSPNVGFIDLDDDGKLYVPVIMLKDNGIYYAWYAKSDKFLGQAESESEIRELVYAYTLKQLKLDHSFMVKDTETDSVKMLGSDT